jgi:competence protein ComEC
VKAGLHRVIPAARTGVGRLADRHWRGRQRLQSAMLPQRAQRAEQSIPTAPARSPDLRVVPLAVAAWGGAWLGIWGVPAGMAAAGLAAVIVLLVALLRRSALLLTVVLVIAVLLGAGYVNLHRLRSGPVATLAAHRAVISAELEIRADPHRVTGTGLRPGAAVMRAETVRVAGRGGGWLVRAPLLLVVSGPQIEQWLQISVGSRVLVDGRLEAPDRGSDVAAVLRVRGSPVVVAPPSPGLRLVERVRAGLRQAVADRPPEPRALVPALVLGDTSALHPELTEDFVSTGLTHLTAVSGANLTLLLAFLLTIARWVGVRGWWLRIVGLAGVIIFVALCRTEPSVLRAAAMGLVALAALGSGSRTAGARNLAVATMILLLVDPFLSRSIGFALSVLACAGIVWWSRRWTMIINRWLPQIIAESIAVPLAAQLVTTPLLAAISGRMSVSGLLANGLAGPFVGPATVLGFAAAGASLLSQTVAAVFGFGAAWCAQMIIWIARCGSQLPGSEWHLSVTPLTLTWLAVSCLVLGLSMTYVLARPWLTLLLVGIMIICLAGTPRQPGWPPRDWVLVVCDVGQGDGIVVRTARGSAIVVDTGPAPAAMRGCLDRLRITRVPLLIITHFHADHVDGLNGVLQHRRVGQVWVSPLATHGPLSTLVTQQAAQHRIPIYTPRWGTRASVGDAELEVLGPVDHVAAEQDDSSRQNDSSLVIMVTVARLRLLLTGDVEPPGQQAIVRTGADLRADVLKIPHHGSAQQDDGFIAATHARLAIASAGVDNDYGHPAPRTVQLVRSLGMTVLSTAQDGSVAVGQSQDGLTAVKQR